MRPTDSTTKSSGNARSTRRLVATVATVATLATGATLATAATLAGPHAGATMITAGKGCPPEGCGTNHNEVLATTAR